MTPGIVAAVFGVAFVVSLGATGLARRAAVRAGRLDAPTERSTHSRPTPRLGGFGIAAGLFLAWALFVPAPMGQGGAFPSLLAGASLFFAVGALDDLRGLRARSKIVLQVAAAVVPVVAGLRLDLSPRGAWPGLPDLGPAHAAVTVLWLVAVVNVVNFLDGIDCIAAVTAIVVLASAAAVGEGGAQGPFLAAVAAVAGFLPWNLPPARIFMGDGGSHLLGFLCGAAALAGPGGLAPGSAPWPMVGAALFPAVVDVAGGLVRKARAGIPLARAHNDHRYQRLVKAGRGHGAVALRYGALAAWLALCAGPIATWLSPAAALALGAVAFLVHVAEAARATAAVPRIGGP